MVTRLLQLYKTNLPPLEAWTKNIAIKMADKKNELVQPIRIENSVNKQSDAI